MENKFAKDKIAEVKEVRKTLPYSIKEIGGSKELQAWKAYRHLKELEWQANASARYEAAKVRAVGVLVGEYAPSRDKNAEIVKVYAKIEESFTNKKPSTILRKNSQKVSLTQRFGEWILNKFLSLKY